MTEQRNALAKLFAACWKDEALKARLMTDSKAVLAEYGIDVPANIDVNVVENSDNTVHITMPQAPAGDGELSDEDLAAAAGGLGQDRSSGGARCCAENSTASVNAWLPAQC